MGKKKKQTTIHGLTFQCEDCGQRFVVGPLGIDAVADRIREHVKESLEAGAIHPNIPPIKPVKGLTYAAFDDSVICVYDGEQDWKDFLNTVRMAVMSNGVDMAPKLELTL